MDNDISKIISSIVDRATEPIRNLNENIKNIDKTYKDICKNIRDAAQSTVYSTNGVIDKEVIEKAKEYGRNHLEFMQITKEEKNGNCVNYSYEDVKRILHMENKMEDDEIIELINSICDEDWGREYFSKKSLMLLFIAEEWGSMVDILTIRMEPVMLDLLTNRINRGEREGIYSITRRNIENAIRRGSLSGFAKQRVLQFELMLNVLYGTVSNEDHDRLDINIPNRHRKVHGKYVNITNETLRIHMEILLQYANVMMDVLELSKCINEGNY